MSFLLAGKLCVWGEGGVLFVYSDRRPAFGSCRQRYIFCTLTGDLLSGLVGRGIFFVL